MNFFLILFLIQTFPVFIKSSPSNPLEKKRVNYLIPNLSQIINEKIDNSIFVIKPSFFNLCLKQKNLIIQIENAITFSTYNPKQQRLIIFIGEHYILKIASLNQFFYDNWEIYDNAATFNMLTDNYSENSGIFLYWSLALQKILNDVDTSELIESFEKLIIIYRQIKDDFPEIAKNKPLFEILQKAFVAGIDLVTNHKRGFWMPNMLKDLKKQISVFVSNLIKFTIFHLSEDMNKIALKGFNINEHSYILEKYDAYCDLENNLDEERFT